MAFATTYTSGGVTYYPYESIPMEAEGSDTRLSGVSVTVTDISGEPLELLSMETKGPLSQPLTSSAVNGVVQSFLAPAGIIVYVVPGSLSLTRTSPGYIDLLGQLRAEMDALTTRVEDAETKAEQATDDAAEAKASLANATTNLLLMSDGSVMPFLGIYDGQPKPTQTALFAELERDL